jgi:hypothetical protein
MSPVKEAAIKLIQSLPENCTFEDIQYHFYVREKVEAGIRAIEAGEVVSEDEADRRITEWLEYFGQNRTGETAMLDYGSPTAR